jgi:hypothetical protein
MTPLIRLEDHMSEERLLELGKRLLDVFERADGVDWNRDIQFQNLRELIEAQKKKLFVLAVPPRFFVFHCCRLLEEQTLNQRLLQPDDLLAFIEDNQIPDSETN